VFQLHRVQDMNFDRPVKMSELETFSARDISVARANDRIVFEHFNEIYKYDPTKIGKARVQSWTSPSVKTSGKAPSERFPCATKWKTTQSPMTSSS